MKIFVLFGLLAFVITAVAGVSVDDPFYCYSTDPIRPQNRMHSTLTSYEIVLRSEVDPTVSCKLTNLLTFKTYSKQKFFQSLHTVKILASQSTWRSFACCRLITTNDKLCWFIGKNQRSLDRILFLSYLPIDSSNNRSQLRWRKNHAVLPRLHISTRLGKRPKRYSWSWKFEHRRWMEFNAQHWNALSKTFPDRFAKHLQSTTIPVPSRWHTALKSIDQCFCCWHFWRLEPRCFWAGPRARHTFATNSLLSFVYVNRCSTASIGSFRYKTRDQKHAWASQQKTRSSRIKSTELWWSSVGLGMVPIWNRIERWIPICCLVYSVLSWTSHGSGVL